MKDLLLFPCGGNARESLLTIQAQNNIQPTWNVVGFIDDNKNLWGKEYSGVKVLDGRSVLPNFLSAQILAVPGNPENFLERAKTIALLHVSPDRFVTIIDPSARISPDAKIGKNTLLMANVVISCSVEIGDHCVVLPNTVISHDSHVGDYSLIGSNVSISGSCEIGHTCYIGSGVKIKDHVTIGPECLVGIGSCVIRDVPARTVVVGNPARFLRESKKHKATYKNRHLK
jgi:sugar O-acyltransferase (sialic acid O-acetyltransferase NeuD family)